MTPAEQLLARVAEFAQRLGVPFVIAVHDLEAGKAKMSASAGAPEQLKPFIARQLKLTDPEKEVPEVSWNDTP